MPRHMQHSASTLAIDGCPAGWVAFVVGGRVRVPMRLVCCTLSELLEKARASVGVPLTTIAIDMPLVGEHNADASERYACFARGMLPRCASRVFSPPAPIALACETFAAANAASKAFSGKGLSKQAWNLAAKVREARALRACLERDERLLEVHPEVCFAQLAGGPVRASKKTAAGVESRLEILFAARPEWAPCFRETCALPPPQRQSASVVPRPGTDDILDAAAMLVVACSHHLAAHIRAQA